MTFPSTPMRSRFRAAILGKAYGDALGFQMEQQPHEACARFAAAWHAAGNIDWPPRNGHEFGQYSDDTQTSRELMLSLLQCDGWNPTAFGLRMVNLIQANRLVGSGGATRQALRRLRDGEPWTTTGHPTNETNGGAMKAAVMGLAFADEDLHTVAEHAAQQARITHAHPVPQAAAAVVAVAVRTLLSCTSPTDLHLRLKANILVALHATPELMTGLPIMLGLEQALAADGDEAALEIVAGLTENTDPQTWDRITPHAVPTVTWALYAFLRHPASYRDAIRTALWAGGDVDTVAAITGALSGALLGEEGLPTEALAVINDQGEWTAAELAALADRLYDWTTARAERTS